MEVVQVRRNFIVLRDIAVVLILRTSKGVCLSYPLSLFESLMRPDSSIKVCSLLLKEIHRHIQELKAGATAEEDHLMSVRNVEQFLPKTSALIHH